MGPGAMQASWADRQVALSLVAEPEAAKEGFGSFRRRNRSLNGPRDHINIRILQITVSGIPLVLGLGTRRQDPCVYTVFDL